MSRALFISDLHLDPEFPDGLERFRRFCREQARDAAALYILGDLFEAWPGDDADDAAAETVAASLAALARGGTAVHLLHGNRDFLIGQPYAERCGAALLPDPVRISLGGRQLTLSHGDGLCSRDSAYMAARPGLRSEAFARALLDRPLAERQALAHDARERSRAHKLNTAEHIMDVTPEAVDALLDRQGTDTLIHGHTHRPGIHRWQTDGVPRTRIVLGAWGEDTRIAIADGANIDLVRWP